MKMIEYAPGYYISEELLDGRVIWFNAVEGTLSTWHTDGMDNSDTVVIKVLGFPVEILPEHCFRAKTEEERKQITN